MTRWIACAFVAMAFATQALSAEMATRAVDDAALSALVARLGDADFEIREQAHDTLLTSGRAAWEFLKQATPGVNDAEARRRCESIRFELDLQFESSETLLARAMADVKDFRFPTAARYVETVRLRTLQSAHSIRITATALPGYLGAAIERLAAAAEYDAGQIYAIQSQLQNASHESTSDTLIIDGTIYIGNTSCELVHLFGRWELIGHGKQAMPVSTGCGFEWGGMW
jgi:hypothetical protein